MAAVVGMLAAVTGTPTTRRVLALHGKGESAVSFRARLAPFLERLDERVSVEFLDAPWPLGDGYQWWRLPPGVRSFEAEQYEGVESSLERLSAEFTRAEVHGVIGFSQGAILLSFFLARELLNRLNGQPALLPSKAILVGAAWPKPFTATMESLRALGPEGLNFLGLDTLHVVGAADNINPQEQAREVAACFGLSGTVHMHAGKHVVPGDDASLTVMSSFLMSGCDSAEECMV